MIKLTKLVELKPLNEQEVFTATNKETGNVSVFKSKASRDAAVKSGSHEMRKDDKKDSVDVKGLDDKPKVNIFNKDKQEPKSSSYSGNLDDMKLDMENAFDTAYTGKGLKGVKKTKSGFQINMASYMNDKSFKDILDAFNKTNGTNFVAGEVEKTFGGTRVSISEPKEQPKSQPSQPKGNEDANKSVRAKADSLEITPEKLGEEDYKDTMIAAAHEALVDSNFHSEARKLLAIVTGDEKLAEKPDYPKMDDPDFSEKMYQISKDREAANKYTNPENDKADILGQTASSEAGWGGEDALYSITSTLREKGFGELADKMDSIFDEEK